MSSASHRHISVTYLLLLLTTISALGILSLLCHTAEILQLSYTTRHEHSYPLLASLDHRRRTAARTHLTAYLRQIHRDANQEELHELCSSHSSDDMFLQLAAQRYSNITTSSDKLYFAVNLYNSEHVAPNIAIQLLALADILGPHRIFVSLYENGSTDRTKQILTNFKRALETLGIPHRIIIDQHARPSNMHRIEYMAQLRNKALEPLYLHSHTRRFAKVVFLNDVFFCATDVLELLSQARIHGAHLTCAEDYQLRHGALAFYDTWVSRDILGNPFKPHHLNIADDATALVAHLNNRPYQVQCCWNGLAVIDAQVFMHPHDIRFRRSAPDECSASECSLLCNDMWAADMHRMVVVPVAKVAYDVETRSYLESSGLVAHKALVANAGRPREIDFRPGPKSVYCHPLNDPAARVPDGPASYVAIINAGAATATAA